MAELIKVDEKVFANLKRSRSYRHTKIQSMLERFACSDEKVAEYTWAEGEYQSPGSAQSVLMRAIKSMHLPFVVRCMNKRVFVIKKEADIY